MPPKRLSGAVFQGSQSKQVIHLLTLLLGLVAGVAVTIVIMTLWSYWKKKKTSNEKEQIIKPTHHITPLVTSPITSPVASPITSPIASPVTTTALGATPQLYRATEQPATNSIESRVAERDRRVDQDNLYPPVSREAVVVRDTYRPVAYLVAEEENKDVWKLYARERGRGGASDFYAVSADRQFDAKVGLTDENVKPRLRDVYNLPTAVQVSHPMFRPNATYQVVEMDRADWGNTPNYF